MPLLRNQKAMRLLRYLQSKGKLPAPTIVDYHKSKIDLQVLSKIRDLYLLTDPDPGYSKYLDCDRYIATALYHADIAGLGAESNLTVLDIGTGAGYFPFVCKNRGQDPEAVDVPNHDFYSQMIKLLGVKRHIHRIKAFEPIPSFGRKYDVITAFAICFNNHAREDLWGAAEWKYFLSDLGTTHMNPGGRAFFRFNQEPNGEYFNSSIRELFKSLRASIEGENVMVTFNR